MKYCGGLAVFNGNAPIVAPALIGIAACPKHLFYS